MTIQVDTLLQQLSAAPESQLILPSVSDYAMNHILQPLRNGETVLFENLDFSKFDWEDIEDMMNRLEVMEQTRQRLEGINQVFCSAVPVSVTKRAFC
jgi:hypothetical protein